MKKIISIALVFLFLLKYNVMGKGSYAVHFLNTGQSDCILIKAEDKNFLIDTGSSLSTSYIISYLKEQKISSLDEVIITHYHSDHYGGLISIVSMINTKKVSLPIYKDIIKDKLYSEVSSRGVPVSFIQKGYEINYMNMHLKAIAPLKNDSILNNNSIVFFGDIDNIKYAFLSDCEAAEEKDIIKSGEASKCYVVKVPHHGLDTSSSKQLLKTLNPKIAVVTCKPPESPVLSILNGYLLIGTSILRTDKQGTIVIEQCKEKVNILLDN